jgi:hypothetical protein
MNKYIKIILIFIFILIVTSNTYGVNRSIYSTTKLSTILKGFELFSPRLILHNRENLKLSTKQIDAIENEILIFETFQIRNGAKIKINELELVSLLSKKNINKNELAKKIRKSGKLKTESFIEYIKHLFKIKDILSDIQIKKLLRRKNTRHKRNNY